MVADLVCEDISESKADELRTRVQLLMRNLATTTWDVAAVVHKLWHTRKHFERWGYKSRNDWLETELGLNPRKAEQLKRMFQYFTIEQKLSPELDQKLRQLDWTKARALVGHVNNENAVEAIDKAASAKRCELEAWIRQQNGGIPLKPEESPNETFRMMNFALADAPDDDSTQYKIVMAGLKRAAELSGSDKAGHNLTLVFLDFLASNGFGIADDPAMLGRFLRQLEQLLGVRLIAFDKKTEEVIFGAETVRWLAKSPEPIAWLPSRCNTVTTASSAGA